MSSFGFCDFFGHSLSLSLPQQKSNTNNTTTTTTRRSIRIGGGSRRRRRRKGLERRTSVSPSLPYHGVFLEGLITCQAQREHRKLSDLSSRQRGSNKRWPLTDDGARRVIKERIAWESQLRKNNPNARGYKWIKRSPSQMAQFLENGRIDYQYAKHVDSAIHTVRKLGSKSRSSYDFGLVMNPWVGRLSFKEMCIILKEQRNWVQAYDFFQWMKRQVCLFGCPL